MLRRVCEAIGDFCIVSFMFGFFSGNGQTVVGAFSNLGAISRKKLADVTKDVKYVGPLLEVKPDTPGQQSLNLN